MGKGEFREEQHMINRAINFLIILFALILGVIFYDVLDKSYNFSLTDELLALFLVIYWMVNPASRFNKEFFIFVCVALFYLCYSLIYPNNVEQAIWTDFFVQLKPFLAFYAVYNMDFSMDEIQKKNIRYICIIAAVLILPIGIENAGNHDMGGLCIHSRYATMMEILGITYLIYSKRTKRDVIISILIMAVGLLSFRSKMFGFFAVYVGVMLFWNPNKKYKILTIRNVFFFCIIAALALYFALDKILFYFVEGADKADMMARPFMYQMSWYILHDYPIFGTGLGTYATYASSVYYSPIYLKYGMDSNYEIGNNLFISDAFYPEFVQFGLVGITLFFFFWRKRFFEAKHEFLQHQDTIVYKLNLLIIIFFVIESIADSTFTQNRGMVMMMILAILLRSTESVKRKTFIKYAKLYNPRPY